jgi:hypothetical protein
MRIIIGLLVLFLTMCNISAQDDLYFSPKSQRRDTLSYSTEISALRYNIGKYHKERQIAWTFAGTAALFSGIGIATTDYSTELAKYMFIASAISSTASIIVFFDSDKWLKKASLGVYPGGVRIKF